MDIKLSWKVIQHYNLTGALYFSGKMTKGKFCLFPIDLFFTLPFADGNHTFKGQVHFCQFRKAGLNMSTEILIPWAGLCSSRAPNGSDLNM